MKSTRGELFNNRFKYGEREFNTHPTTKLVIFGDYLIVFNNQTVINLFKTNHSIPEQIIEPSSNEGTAIIERALNSETHTINGSVYFIVTPSGRYTINIPNDSLIDVEGIRRVYLNNPTLDLVNFNKEVCEIIFNKESKTKKLGV